MFLGSPKYDPGCSSRIRMLIFFTHPGSRIHGGQTGTGSRIRIRNKKYEVKLTVVEGEEERAA
jgi:hypothetical protein